MFIESLWCYILENVCGPDHIETSVTSLKGGDVSSNRIPGRTPSSGPGQHRGLNYQPINWLLLVPLIGTLIPVFYNFTSPSLGGIPFFYWYQLAWIPVSVICTWIVFRSTRKER